MYIVFATRPSLNHMFMKLSSSWLAESAVESGAPLGVNHFATYVSFLFSIRFH